jgi:hypothetical protein
MKKTICFIFTFATFLIIACNNQKKAVIENPYVGAWEITYSKYIYPDSTYETSSFTNPTVKLLTNKHYAFGRQGGKNLITGGGGEYTFKDDVFKSFPKYHTGSFIVGDSIVMKSKIEGDLWTISFSIKNDSLKVDATEIWKRIPE